MYYCPHCQKPSAYNAGPCPHCGKELAPKPPAPKPPAAAQPAPEGQAGQGAGEGQAEYDPMGLDPTAISLDEGEGGSLELELDPEAVRRAPPRRPVDEEKVEEASIEVSEEYETEKKKKKVVVIDPEEELRQLSGYGPVPEGWGGSINYLFKVQKQKKVLANTIATLEEAMRKKKEDLDNDLMIIGRRKMTEKGVEKKYGMETEAIRVATENVKSAREEKNTEAQDMEDKEAYLDEEIMKLQNEVDRYRVEEETLGRNANEKTADYKKAKSKLQRYDIEIRNVRQLMVGKGKGAAPPDPAMQDRYQRQIQQLELDKSGSQPDVEVKRQAAEEVDRQLAAVRSHISELMGKITLANKRKTQVVSSLKQRSKEIEERYGRIQEDYNSAIRNLALSSFENEDLPSEFSDMQEKLQAKVDSIDETDEKLKKIHNARDSYSRSAIQRATILLGGGAGLVILLIILLAIIL